LLCHVLGPFQCLPSDTVMIRANQRAGA
jgi:hypothetical protein